MDFRLPQPLKYSLRKKRRRWKLLREETKKLSLKHHKKDASCQTDSSESSEGVNSCLKNANSQVRETDNRPKIRIQLGSEIEIENHSENLPGNRNLIDTVDHICSPARRNRVNLDEDCFNTVYSSFESNTKDDVCLAIVTTVNERASLNSSVNMANGDTSNMKDSLGKFDRSGTENSDFLPCIRYPGSSSTFTGSFISEKHSNLVVSGSPISKHTVKNNLTEWVSTSESKTVLELNNTIVLSDSTIDSSVNSFVSCQSDSKSGVRESVNDILDKSTISEMSELLLESSFSSKNNTTKSFDLKNKSKIPTRRKPFPRSSALHKRFNKAVETDFGLAGDISDFYLRVKTRVLGLNNSTKENSLPDFRNGKGGKENRCDGEFKCLSKSNEDFHRRFSNDQMKIISSDVREKDNMTNAEDINSKLAIKYQKTLPDKTHVLHSPLSSPEIVSESEESVNHINSSVCGENQPTQTNLRVLPKQKKMPCVENSDSENTPEKVIEDVKFRRKKRNSVRQKSSECNEPVVVRDSELSSSSGGIECRKRNGIFVIRSSDSDCSSHSKSDSQDEIDLLNDFHESDLDEIQDSGSRNPPKKKEDLNLNSNQNSGSSDVFRRVTKRALVLNITDSHCESDKQNGNISNGISSSKNNSNDAFDKLLYKPGFSTLSQSKHEDIKKWLHTIPCSSNEETRENDDKKALSKKITKNVPKQKDDDAINLTDMQEVLNELYGPEWGDKTKVTPKVISKKKESQIVTVRLTDSDDSSTPPLPPSIVKKRLYNENNYTPKESRCTTPITATKKFHTPRTVGSKIRSCKSHLGSGTLSSPVLTFLSSLSVDHQSARCHPEAKYFVKNFKSKKEELALKLFHIFNSEVFSSKLPHDMPIIWNNRLRKTAGYCYNRRIKNSEGSFTRTARVELSSKIIDNAARLRDTLIHELCHAATWIISEVTGGHGPTWKRWTNKAREVFPELPPISRCHSYDIVTKYKYKCSDCNYSIGRHSKSLDIQSKVCGICGGKFELFLNKNDGTGKPVATTPRRPNVFAMFVKENYSATKKSQSNLKHKEVMKLLSEKFAETKIAGVQEKNGSEVEKIVSN